MEPSELWRTKDFRMGGTEVPQAPMGVGVGRRYTAGRVCVRGCAPPQKIFRIFR